MKLSKINYQKQVQIFDIKYNIFKRIPLSVIIKIRSFS